MKPKLHIVVCSTRPVRVGPAVGEWMLDQARAHGGFDAELVDLAEFKLPILDEPEHPRLQKYQHEHTKKWSASVAAADAFVFVLPEYNFGPPASLVNAMQYLQREWHYKPVAMASYGGVSGGMRSAQAARALVTTYKMAPIPEAVTVINAAQQLDDHRQLITTGILETSATAMLDELERWTRALATLRAPA